MYKLCVLMVEKDNVREIREGVHFSVRYVKIWLTEIVILVILKRISKIFRGSEGEYLSNN